MKHVVNLPTLLVGTCCVLALAVGIYPGVLNDCFLMVVFLAIVIAPFLAIVAIPLCFWLHRSGYLKHLTFPKSQIYSCLLFVLVCFTLLMFGVPRRLAFAVSRSDFQQFVNNLDHSAISDKSLQLRLGLYHIDGCSVDPRGGVYFRTYSGYDAIDVMSYGFCYHPNTIGSPFGTAHYQTYTLGNGWHWFRASDDY